MYISRNIRTTIQHHHTGLGSEQLLLIKNKITQHTDDIEVTFHAK